MKDATMRKLAAHFLAELGERYSTDGCNDFDFDDLVPDVEERRAIMFAAEKANGTPEDFHPNEDYRCVQNFVVLGAVEAWITKGGKK